MTGLNVGIVGASGAVGREILRLLDKRNFPVYKLRCFSSGRSAGTVLDWKSEKIVLEEAGKESFKDLDLVFFSAGGAVSKLLAWDAVHAGALVIDNSSSFRMDPDVPLIVPEINAPSLEKHKGLIANPNCSTIIMLMALAPLHREAKIKRIVAATYQAASGAGTLAMKDLWEETYAQIENRPYKRSVIPHPYAFNVFLHNSPISESGYVEEELKMLYETRKILEDDTLRLTATCVRVPVLRAHSEALNVEFHHSISAKRAEEILRGASGIAFVEDRKQNRFPMPSDAVGRDEVLCGRIREDMSQPNTLELWLVADQLLKGAALNAVQIAELLTSSKKIAGSL